MFWMCKIFGHKFVFKNPYECEDENKVIEVIKNNNICVRCGYFEEEEYETRKSTYYLINTVKNCRK